MIGTSWLSYISIRASILGFRFIAPLSILYTAARPFLPAPFGFHSRLANVLSIYPLTESIFCLFIYFPLRAISQKPAIHPPLQTHEEREQLFERCVKTIDDPVRYIRKWFRDAPLEEVKKENVREFASWAFYNADGVQKSEGEGLEHFVEGIERLLGSRFDEGRGNAQSIRLTIDPVVCWHRPLIWYGVSTYRRFCLLRHLYQHGWLTHSV